MDMLQAALEIGPYLDNLDRKLSNKLEEKVTSARKVTYAYWFPVFERRMKKALRSYRAHLRAVRRYR
jgi:hypothetical protein